LVRSFDRYICCDFSKTTSPIFVKFSTDVQHLCRISLLTFEKSRSRSKAPYWKSSNRNNWARDRPKFGFGFGYETGLTYGFGLVSAMAKVHWRKFGFRRNITPKRRNRRNCKIGVKCSTGSLAVRLLAVGGQGAAYASWYRRPKTW